MYHVVVSFCVAQFFFFKQKTAYEMRISDWSSDVCSSDLGLGDARQALVQQLRRQVLEVQVDMILVGADAAALADLHGHGAADHVAAGEILGGGRVALHEALALGVGEIAEIGRASCRERVCPYV